MAFQIQDDILDVIGSAEELGKPINSDEKNHKSTYVNLLGIDAAKLRMETLYNKALTLLNELSPEKTEWISTFVHSLIDRTN